MSSIVALGEQARIEAFALAGVGMVPAADAGAARAAWAKLGRDVAVVILTRAAQAALSDLLSARPDVIWTVMPE